MSDDRYTRCDRSGKAAKSGSFDFYTIYNIRLAEQKLGYELTVLQGGYNKGGVAASAGTHDAAAAIDLAPFDWARKVRVLRELGFAAWHRTAIKGVWAEHVHAILIGNTKASRGALQQVASYKAGRNGLANNAVDKTWRPSPIKNAAYSTVKPVSVAVRVATFNWPGEDKLPDPAARSAAGAALVVAARPSVCGLNEMVGINAGGASDWAKRCMSHLPSTWRMVKPTSALNENYALIDATKTKFVKQYGDSIIRVKVGKRTVPGRHVTRFVVQDKATGLVYAVGVTHLVNSDAEGAHAQSVKVADTMGAVSRKHGNCPIVIVGDMNLDDDPRGFAALVSSRTAPSSSTRDNDTFVTYKGTKPTKAGRRYDQIWVRGGVPKGYNVTLDVDTKGKFRQPRPSDHLVTVAALILTH